MQHKDTVSITPIKATEHLQCMIGMIEELRKHNRKIMQDADDRLCTLEHIDHLMDRRLPK